MIQQVHSPLKRKTPLSDGIPTFGQTKQKLVYSNGDIYEGETLNTIRHGWGVYLYNSAAMLKTSRTGRPPVGTSFRSVSHSGDMTPKYEGMWFGGTKHGFGTFLALDGSVHAGTWVHDVAHGDGISIKPNGDRYEGGFKNGLRHGYGRITSTKGGCFIGSFEDNVPHGRGLRFGPYALTVFWERYDNGTIVEREPLDKLLPILSLKQTATTKVSEAEKTSSSIAQGETASVLQGKSFGEWNREEIDTLFDLLGIADEVVPIIEYHKLNGEGLVELLKLGVFTGDGTDGSNSSVLSENRELELWMHELGLVDASLSRFFTRCCVLLLRTEFKRKEWIQWHSTRVARPPLRAVCADYINKNSTLKSFLVASKDLQKVKKIGEGGFGTVYMARSVGWQINVAVKEFRKSLFSDDSNASQSGTRYAAQLKAVQEFLAEVQVLAAMRHPNVAMLLGVCAEENYQAIITELVTGGSLFDVLHKRKVVMELPQILQIAQGVCSAMVYLHHHGVLHCDIKSSNVLLWNPVCPDNEGASASLLVPGSSATPNPTESNTAAGERPRRQSLIMQAISPRKGLPTRLSPSPMSLLGGTSFSDNSPNGSPEQQSLNRWIPKLTDFGLAKSLWNVPTFSKFGDFDEQLDTTDIVYRFRGHVGTPHWMAPEILRGGEHSTKSDVYAFGLVLWEMIANDVPFSALAVPQIVAGVGWGRMEVKMPAPSLRCPSELIALTSRCLAYNPAERPSFQALDGYFSAALSRSAATTTEATCDAADGEHGEAAASSNLNTLVTGNEGSTLNAVNSNICEKSELPPGDDTRGGSIRTGSLDSSSFTNTRGWSNSTKCRKDGNRNHTPIQHGSSGGDTTAMNIIRSSSIVTSSDTSDSSSDSSITTTSSSLFTDSFNYSTDQMVKILPSTFITETATAVP